MRGVVWRPQTMPRLALIVCLAAVLTPAVLGGARTAGRGTFPDPSLTWTICNPVVRHGKSQRRQSVITGESTPASLPTPCRGFHHEHSHAHRCTSLEASRTLRAVVEAPFLSNEQKIETLYLAAITRKPRAEEMEYLKSHVASKATDDERKQAYAEILWGLLNGPEFVLSR